MAPEEQQPQVSVIVASKVGEPFIDRCLRSLEQQARRHDAEVLVVTGVGGGYGAWLAEEFPWTRVIVDERLSEVPALRRRGVEEAQGALVAVIEEHCTAADDWLERVLASHGSGAYGAVGGPIADAGYKRIRDWVVYFIEYNGAMPPIEGGEGVELNDANIAYRRELLLDHLDLLDRGYWPMALHPVLRAQGTRFLAVPDMVVHHQGPFDFGYYLQQRYWFSRAYAGERARSQSMLHRLVYLLAAPVIPFVLLARIGRAVLDKGQRVPEFVRSLPLMVPALIVLVAGEWVAYLLGPGDALSKVE